MSLYSLSQAMPAIQSALPSRLENRASGNTSAASSAAASNASGRSASGSSSLSLRAARLLASEQRHQQAPSGSSSSTPMESAATSFERAAPRAFHRQRAIIYTNPPTAFMYGVPVTVFAATCISMGLNLISIILLASANCSFAHYQVRHMFGFLVLAQIALGSALLFNMFYHHYNNNCLSLSMSFLFSGSAALLIFSLIETLVSGLCKPAGTPDGSILVSKYPANYAVWFLTLISVTAHMISHFYYG